MDFDPLHSGHISYLKEAKKLGDKLVVGLNSDEWLTHKKGKPFLNYYERRTIVEALEVVDCIVEFNDDDGTACDAIEQVLRNTEDDVVFANGGDRNNTTTPEYQKYQNHPNVEFAFGVGGEYKKNSSSWLLNKWSKPTTERNWGKYTVLDNGEGWKVKQLEFNVGKALSNQRHFHRSEHWCVVTGEIRIDLKWPDGTKEMCLLSNGESVDIPAGVWHKAINVGETPAQVIEVWMGLELSENDIERSD